jgi:magnesium chelatase family protein
LPDTDGPGGSRAIACAAALQNCAVRDFPSRKITVNLAPADLPKESGRYDLPIAIGVLAATARSPATRCPATNSRGSSRWAEPCAPSAERCRWRLCARRDGRAFVLPSESATEAALVRDATVYPASSLLAVCAHLTAREPLTALEPVRGAPPSVGSSIDLGDVRGQDAAKRALTIAAAGAHSLLMMGPPGTGKSMLGAAASRPAAVVVGGGSPRGRVDRIARRAIFAERMGRATVPRAASHRERGRARGRRQRSAPRRNLAGAPRSAVPRRAPEWDRKVLEVLREPLESGSSTFRAPRDRAAFPRISNSLRR